jgi:hypothetical protein
MVRFVSGIFGSMPGNTKCMATGRVDLTWTNSLQSKATTPLTGPSLACPGARHEHNLPFHGLQDRAKR